MPWAFRLLGSPISGENHFCCQFTAMAPFTLMRYFSALGLCLALLLPQMAQAQAAAPLPTFYTTYHYTGYTVYDNSSAAPPTEVRGVGGSLVLRPDGTYEKR